MRLCMKKILTSKSVLSEFINFLIIISLIAYGVMSAHQARAQEFLHQLQSAEVNLLMEQMASYDRAEAEYTKQLDCLAKNIYFEARSEGLLGQRAVAWVTLNRVHSDRFPDTICKVVQQAVLDDSGNPVRDKCQFSWFCDGKSDDVKNKEKWDLAVRMAETVLTRFGAMPDPTDGAIMYHADYVSPYWKNDFTRTTKIDSHVFYAEEANG